MEHYSVIDLDSGNVIGIAKAGDIGQLESLVMLIAEEEFVGVDSRLVQSISPKVMKYEPVDCTVEVFDDNMDEWYEHELQVQYVNLYE